MSHPYGTASVVLALALTTFACGQTTGTVAARYQEGVALYDGGQYHRALRAWEDLLEHERDTLTRQQRVALMTRIAAANRMLKTAPEANTPQAQAQRAIDQATELFDTAVSKLRNKNERESAPAMFGQVVDLLVQAEGLGAGGNRIDHMMAFACLQANRLSQGWPYLDKTIAATPSDPRPLNLKADYLKKRGAKPADRIAILERSVKLDGTQREVHKALCLEYLALRQRRYLQPAFDHAVKAVGTDPALARQLAEVFPEPEYKNRLDALAARLAVDRATEQLPSVPSWKQTTFGEGRVSSTMIRVP